METFPPDSQKKGLGPLAWIGIGCGGILLLVVIGLVVFSLAFGGKIKQFAEDAQKNPSRAVATGMVKMGLGQIEMVAEDDAGKRYTVREKQNGKLTTIYWNAKTQAPEVVAGDFTAIPAEPAVPPETPPSPVPEPAQN